MGEEVEYCCFIWFWVSVNGIIDFFLYVLYDNDKVVMEVMDFYFDYVIIDDIGVVKGGWI